MASISSQMPELTKYDDRQTQGKTFPYLFSQCQPIYARSLLPVQGMDITLSDTRERALIFSSISDTPSVKIVRILRSPLPASNDANDRLDIRC